MIRTFHSNQVSFDLQNISTFNFSNGSQIRFTFDDFTYFFSKIDLPAISNIILLFCNLNSLRRHSKIFFSSCKSSFLKSFADSLKVAKSEKFENLYFRFNRFAIKNIFNKKRFLFVKLIDC